MNKYAPLLIDIIAGIFILLFAYTALNKVDDMNRMELTIAKSPVIGDKAKVVAWSVVVIEIAVTALLFIPRLRYHGIVASLILMIVFSFYVGSILAFAGRLPCACGGVISSMSWSQHLVFNLVFTLIAAVGVWLFRKNKDFIAINRRSRIPVEASRQSLTVKTKK